ncbi:CHAT domain-containing protein [Moorena sp. SIO3B2]|uniref:CHAT domain-containing protein n=1 Tax=Moorena sp. SIO3B2 TaxID=2607827 RepID=UPI0013CCCC55|nr:CHAT domain-containing protein [Moorena sp. SIO3B2]NEP34667.1 CHAT domain-containing protein [Moorena sp. SIO3B2]
MDEQSSKAYLKLINALLTCSSGKESEILRANQELIDKNLILTMVGVSETLVEQGDRKAADWLQNLAEQLAEALGGLEQVKSQTTKKSNSAALSTSEDYVEFLMEVLQATAESQGNPQVVYPLLQANLDKLDDNLTQILRVWFEVILSENQPEQEQYIAVIVSDFSNLIQQFPLGNRAINLEIAITGFEIGLTTFTLEAFPEEWGIIQNNLGNGYKDRILGDRAENLEQAIACYQHALRVYTCNEFPELWAATQNNLANAYSDRIYGEKTENLEQAIACYQNALRVYTREAFPQQWSKLYNNLGATYSKRIRGDRAENLEMALQAYHAAWQVRTRGAFPMDWAATQSNLATAYSDRIRGNRAENLEQAIACYQNALEVYARSAFPEAWAMTQNNLAVAYRERIRGDKATNLEMSIRAYHAALEVRTREAFPMDWAATQSNLAIAYSDRIRGNRAENLEQAIACSQSALQVYTRSAFPEAWAMTQNNLAVAYRERIRGDKATNLEMSIQAYHGALEVRTREAFPIDWAATQSNLAIAYSDRIRGNRAENLEQAIACCQRALQVYTREAFPEQWARTQSNLATAYRELGQIAKALTYYKNALEVFLPKAFPVDCLRVGRNLGDTAFAAGFWTEAIEGYDIAIEAVEQSRTWASTEARREEILSAAIDVYSNMVQACINIEQFDRALEYVERSKARNLVEILATKDLYPKGNIPKTVLKELDRLRREIVREQRRLNIEESIRSTDGSFDPSTDIKQNRTKLEQLIRQLDQLIKHDIHPIDPAFNLTQKIEPISFKQIKQLLPDQQTALIEWYVTSETFLTFIVTSCSHMPTVLQASPEDLQTLLDWTSSYLSSYYDNRQQWRNELDDRLRQLADILNLKHLLSLIPINCQRLILIPHRFLHMFPLHALEVGGQDAKVNSQNSATELLNNLTLGESLAISTQLRAEHTKRELPLAKDDIVQQKRQNCLLDLYPGGVSYAPSCQLLQTVEARHTSSQQHNLDRLFIVQNPTNDLHFTDLEVTAISAYFDQAYILAKQAATKEALNQEEALQNAHIVHFSCHGYFNLASPLESGLRLANNKDLANNEDLANNGYLTLEEVFELDLTQSRLVTLSACETGLTDITSLSDEYTSLPSGFLYAGSSNVVSSLWEVNDLSTTFLMIKFYENLKNETSAAIALSQAQRWLRDTTLYKLEQWIRQRQLPFDHKLRKLWQQLFNKVKGSDKPFAHPLYWAAFTCQGL